MRRAFLEASRFSRLRTAFGRPIVDVPARAREPGRDEESRRQAALASSLELTALVARIDAGTATEDDVAWHRILVNANKFSTSLAATGVVRRGIEALGGNGTIEDFSPLPRLYRDAIVFESWEGTHNVLCVQVLRDLAKLDAVELVLERVRGVASGVPEVESTLDSLATRLRRSLAEPAFGAQHARRQVDTLARALQAACLVRDGHEAEARLLARRRLVPGWDAESDDEYPQLVEAVLTEPA